MKTIMMNGKISEDKWVHIDAENMVMGRLASKVARLVKGKETAEYQQDVNPRIFVVITNSDKVKLTGNKKEDKMYHKHSGYVGGLKSMNYNKIMERKPTFPLRKAIKGMLPKNRLGRQLLTQIKIYASNEHPHTSQKPDILK